MVMCWQYCCAESSLDVYLEENPSSIADVSGGLISQTGPAVVTELELQLQREQAPTKQKDAVVSREELRRTGEAPLPEQCKGYTGAASHKVKAGDVMSTIAYNTYGNSAYATLISVVNQKPVSKIYVGEELITPSPLEVFTKLDGQEVYRRYPYAIRDLLSIHERYKELCPTLLEQRGGLHEDTVAKIDQMLWELNQTKKDFFMESQEVTDYPLNTAAQLQSAYLNLKEIRKGQYGKKDVNLQKVHMYLVNCYSYAMAWGRDGFTSK